MTQSHGQGHLSSIRQSQGHVIVILQSRSKANIQSRSRSQMYLSHYISVLDVKSF